MVKGGKAGSHTHTEGSRIPRVLASIQETVCYEPNQIMCTHAAPVEVARPRDVLAPTC